MLARDDSLSLKSKWMMKTACTLIIFVLQHERLISVDIVPHLNRVSVCAGVRLSGLFRVLRVLGRLGCLRCLGRPGTQVVWVVSVVSAV